MVVGAHQREIEAHQQRNAAHQNCDDDRREVTAVIAARGLRVGGGRVVDAVAGVVALDAEEAVHPLEPRLAGRGSVGAALAAGSALCALSRRATARVRVEASDNVRRVGRGAEVCRRRDAKPRQPEQRVQNVTVRVRARVLAGAQPALIGSAASVTPTSVHSVPMMHGEQLALPMPLASALLAASK